MHPTPSLAIVVVAFVGCGDSAAAPEAPTLVRKCGELDGVVPVEPVTLGEDGLGCAVFAPVPCVRSKETYASVCGADCWPETAVTEDGDEWLLGCRSNVAACLAPDAEPTPRVCLLDPHDGGRFWGSRNACFVAAFCWERCDGRSVLCLL